MLELADRGGAGQRVLAHTHWLVAVINLAHLAFLAVVVQAGVCKENTARAQKQLIYFAFSCF